MDSIIPAKTTVHPMAASCRETQPITPVASDPSTSKSAVVSTVSSPIRETAIAANAAPKPTGPLPGYKLIKRRKEDGTFITVMRKMSPQEVEAAERTRPTSYIDHTTAEPKLMTSQGIKYNIITVRDSTGAFIRVKRPIKPEDSSSTQPPPYQDKIKSGSNLVAGPEGDARSGSTQSVQSSTSEIPKSTDTYAAGPAIGPEAGPIVVQENSIDMSAALARQTEMHRKKRMHRMSGSLLHGLGTILGSSIGQMHFDMDNELHGGHEAAGDIEDGDLIDSDQSWSDDDADNDDGNNDDGELHHESPTHVQFNAAGAAGRAITALATQAASAPPKPVPTAQAGVVDKNAEDKNKITYHITAMDLEEMDKKAADKDIERPLRHHWTNITFYLMGSLSVVLPLLFLLLAMFIFMMKGKPTSSSWHVMPDVIKVGISAWPIVFAAVVAQVFKAYATWKVERGIKLMQLEQLVGSNSFGNAIKQPMVLRQLDVLTLLLLLTWCLSPFGSQALQRSYYTGFAQEADTVEVHYLNQTGANKVFGRDWVDTTSATAHAADNQMTAILFLSTLVPWDDSGLKGDTSEMDQYYHPVLQKPTDSLNDTQPIAGSGIPIVLPETKLTQAQSAETDTAAQYEDFYLNVTSSYYEFICGDWSTVNYTTLEAVEDPDQDMVWSSSRTLGMKFTDPGNKSTITHLLFASANLNTYYNVSTDWTSWDYSLIQCDFQQHFIDSMVGCWRWPSDPESSSFSTTGLNCWSGHSNIISPDVVASQYMGTQLEDFSDDWTAMAAPRNPDKTGVYSTPTEIYIQNGYADYTSAAVMNLVQNTTSIEFADNFAYLFNTWVGVGYCPQCSSINTPSDFNSSDLSIQERYISVNATRYYSGEETYLLSLPWTISFLISTVLLLIAGIISVIVESITVAPDTLGYVSTVARNSRYLHVKPTSGAMTGAERARKLADTKVMMQDVKANADVGKIALGLKSDKAVQLQANRLYR